jgi:RNA polymerase sigma-70 factor (ECF subfamily)
VARPDFCQLALPHMGALYRTATRLTSRVSEAEDLVQETYLEGFRSYASLRDPERCRAWLFRILHNLWTDRRRRDGAEERATNGHKALAAVNTALAPVRDLEREITSAGYSDEVERALQALPEEFRTALLLVTVEELSYAEVAEVMGCPIGTVRSRLARGRALLATALATARAEEPRKESL